MPTLPYVLKFDGGIKRDGTVLDTTSYVDGLWCRFMRGKPRKMGGYTAVGQPLTGPHRGVHVYPYANGYYIHVFSQSKITKIQTDINLNIIGVYDRTPAGFVQSPNNNWQYDVMYDTGSALNYLIAHCTDNLAFPSAGSARPIYYGDVAATGALVSNGTSVDGGIVALHPYLFAYGSNGFIQWGAANTVTTMSGAGSGNARICALKILRGYNSRGGPSNAPAGVFWSQDNVIRCAFVGGAPIFSFDDISDASSVLSSNGMVEFDGLYYWIGNGRFLVYNGTVLEVPNLQNINWFVKNLNWTQRQKVWATKIEQFGEIWWFAPMFGATECNWAIIYNVREGKWYDTPIGRSAGYFSQTLQFPIWADSSAVDTASNFFLWQHEVGTDQVISGNHQSILSFFETGPMSWWDDARKIYVFPGKDRWMDLHRVEPDFNQTGLMNMIVRGRHYATDSDTDSIPYALNPQTTAIPSQKQDLKEQRRELRLKFISNTLGGFYEMGSIVVTADLGDARQ